MYADWMEDIEMHIDVEQLGAHSIISRHIVVVCRQKKCMGYGKQICVRNCTEQIPDYLSSKGNELEVKIYAIVLISSMETI